MRPSEDLRILQLRLASSANNALCRAGDVSAVYQHHAVTLHAHDLRCIVADKHSVPTSNDFAFFALFKRRKDAHAGRIQYLYATYRHRRRLEARAKALPEDPAISDLVV